jgi:6-pyruvoyltetrahydropterin/6-carboxytetrahydropterin synthase
MYTVAVTRDFIANHFLIGGDWGSENFPHAHHYVAEVSIESNQLDKHGYLVDIVEIEAALDKVVGYFRDSLLNDKEEFAGLNPSIDPPGAGSLNIKLWENATCWAAYRKQF